MQNTLSMTVGKLDEAKGAQEVKFSGEFDKAGYTAVREELNDLVKNFGGKSLVFNFSGLKFINSEGIGHLMEIHSFLGKSDKVLAIVGPNAHVKDVFGAVGMDQIMPVHESLSAFLSSKK